MITKINLKNVACYKDLTYLETDKKVNLIYGLNGAGKSTLSDYLNKYEAEKYASCSIEGLNTDDEILVYNQTFIRDNFFETENLNGIFTLSKENKEAEIQIANAHKEIENLKKEENTKIKDREAERLNTVQKQNSAKDKIWKIKTDFSGGDRVLEFCLDGYKGSKDSLFNFIINVPKSVEKPSKSIEDLKIEFYSISGDNAQKLPSLSQVNFESRNIEYETIFNKQIVGNENSTISNLIMLLGNSDWVKAGLDYIPDLETQENSNCPFCQEKTISSSLVKSIKNYFDASYEADISKLKSLLDIYSKAVQDIPGKANFEMNPKFEFYKKDFEIKYNSFIKVVEENRKLMEEKIKTPSISITLKNSATILNELNQIIDNINKLVAEHNNNIDQKEVVKKTIKKTFWEIMRWDYDQTILFFYSEVEESKNKIEKIKTTLNEIENKIKVQKELISEQQKNTVNIDEAITNIKNGLIDLGITEFEIKKHSENLYKIVRGENEDKVFRSLSEGERMIISFLYFVELCRGKKVAAETGKKKIIVIDDPISSLSHIYVFNIGRLIHSEFLRGEKYKQIFLLTHSLYFFYEMTDTNKERRKEQQKLFRIRKNTEGSSILEMSYEEIQNDYHSYWFIIKDNQQPPALIANCMRNIIEYFFNFVEKKDLNNVFQKQAMQEHRFQAFCRYINRESHSLGQNIFDLKEFNYDDFKDAFSLIFKENGYEEHFKKMIR